MTKRPNAIGIRPRPETRTRIEQIAKEEGRTVANVVVFIVDQYLSLTKGKLKKLRGEQHESSEAQELS